MFRGGVQGEGVTVERKVFLGKIGIYGDIRED